MQRLLDAARQESAACGIEPGFLHPGTAVRHLQAALQFYAVLKSKAQEKNCAPSELLHRVLSPSLQALHEGSRQAPDAKTSRRCVERLTASFGAFGTGQEKISVGIKDLVRHLTGIDLRFDNDRNRPSTQFADNPIPRTGPALGLHDRFNTLELPGNRAAFARFFNAESSAGRAWTATGEMSPNFAYVMLFLQQLEERTVVHEPTPSREIEAALKHVFSVALGRTVATFDEVGALSQEERATIRNELQCLPGFSKENQHRTLPFIEYLTGTLLRAPRRGVPRGRQEQAGPA
ncbi:MAG TPA: hypothetical protein VIM12_13225 [Noviherbaspirillum sp.]|jgi:hypothetical protein|uniref:hypothetical protein n=1 Tax=Noviherbaspirillum sp. TaxID=1926288 RepID=UPI002F91DD4D